MAAPSIICFDLPRQRFLQIHGIFSHWILANEWARYIPTASYTHEIIRYPTYSLTTLAKYRYFVSVFWLRFTVSGLGLTCYLIWMWYNLCTRLTPSWQLLRVTRDNFCIGAIRRKLPKPKVAQLVHVSWAQPFWVLFLRPHHYSVNDFSWVFRFHQEAE